MLRPPEKDVIVRLISSQEAAIRKFGVRKLALLGSVVRGETSPSSDVDILVEFEPSQKSFDNFLGLSGYLENLLGFPVELVTTESLNPFIGPQILAEAADVLHAA